MKRHVRWHFSLELLHFPLLWQVEWKDVAPTRPWRITNITTYFWREIWETKIKTGIDLWPWINEESSPQEAWEHLSRLTQSTQETRMTDSSAPTCQLPFPKKTEGRERMPSWPGSSMTHKGELQILSCRVYGKGVIPWSHTYVGKQLDNFSLLILIWGQGLGRSQDGTLSPQPSNPSRQVIHTTSLNTYFAFAGSQTEVGVSSLGQGIAWKNRSWDRKKELLNSWRLSFYLHHSHTF